MIYVLGILVVGLIGYIIHIHIQIKSINTQIRKRIDTPIQTGIRTTGTNASINELIDSYNQLLLAYTTLQKDFIVANNNVKQMTASISHDFRTPLTSMRGYIQLIQEDINHPKNKERLKTIENRIVDLNQHVEDFYMLSLIDSKEYPLDLKRLDITTLLQNFVAQYYEDLAKKFPSLEFTIDEQHIWVYGDEHTYKRIFGNLIRNALQHGSDWFEITSTLEANKVSITFSNRAQIESHEVDKVFERNYRGEKSRNSQTTGLGLSITKELVILMQGSLEAFVNEDTLTFKLELPTIKEKA